MHRARNDAQTFHAGRRKKQLESKRLAPETNRANHRIYRLDSTMDRVTLRKQTTAGECGGRKETGTYPGFTDK